MKLLSALLLFFLVACNQTAPLQDTDGHTLRFSDYRGKWVLINYWASWCEPCHEEIPELNALAVHYKDKLQIFGVSYDKVSLVDLQHLIIKMGMVYPDLTTDPAAFLGIDNVSGLPTTFILDPKGRLFATLYGKQTQQELVELLELKS